MGALTIFGLPRQPCVRLGRRERRCPRAHHTIGTQSQWRSRVAPRRSGRGHRGQLARRDIAFKAEHLRLEPNCSGCGRPAEQVDHILPLAKGGVMFDHANAQRLCVPCHDRKT
ncbi:HNH endonuclease [Saccharopolyspora shandongensis]|uniref:HNH endonuclease n=1 Tax=Saccharopolyspora shandongensis TaxID=418495 RepID=UPI00344222B5